MIKFEPSKHIKALICDQMGDDIDQPACDELIKYMEECPECKVFYDSVQKVVKLYRVTEEEQDVPDDVSDRLFKVLHLPKDS